MRKNSLTPWALWAVLVAGMALTGFGCTGGSREVFDCNQCHPSTTTGPEYCVMGKGSDLYCANGCFNSVDCVVNHFCVPLMDQGTPWETSAYGKLRWVCMPSTYYNEYRKVYRVSGNCNTGAASCPSGWTCLYDDLNPANVIYFCSESCTAASQCYTGCCYTTASSNRYCAPFSYCN